ncbi:hypothetical protein G7Y89_g12945 [Cudoniella acicularis]|uniref:Aldehyde dehydrogenase domain-containing protein n=1 Tax=Cudoniella acicularis TaxID=354080 RepID=A0A8H4RAU4_9HELO|nr:hypothetical protein G7Y89_g12945 [Cudoniella acicularis]
MAANTPKLDFDTFHNIINGQLTTTPTITYSLNPATGLPNAPVPLSTLADTNLTVASASTAQKSWAKTTIFHRRTQLLTFADTLSITYLEQFTQLLIAEQGNRISLPATRFFAPLPLSAIPLNSHSHLEKQS